MRGFAGGAAVIGAIGITVVAASAAFAYSHATAPCRWGDLRLASPLKLAPVVGAPTVINATLINAGCPMSGFTDEVFHFAFRSINEDVPTRLTATTSTGGTCRRLDPPEAHFISCPSGDIASGASMTVRMVVTFPTAGDWSWGFYSQSEDHPYRDQLFEVFSKPPPKPSTTPTTTTTPVPAPERPRRPAVLRGIELQLRTFIQRVDASGWPRQSGQSLKAARFSVWIGGKPRWEKYQYDAITTSYYMSGLNGGHRVKTGSTNARGIARIPLPKACWRRNGEVYVRFEMPRTFPSRVHWSAFSCAGWWFEAKLRAGSDPNFPASGIHKPEHSLTITYR
jgi:hypothetical protein